MCTRIAMLCLFGLSSALLLAVVGATDAQQKKQQRKTEYVFQPEDARRVVLQRFPFFYEGHLNFHGEFVPDPKARPIKYDDPMDKYDEWTEALERKKFPIFNMHRAGLMLDSVYQYLGGDWLILGMTGGGADFVPAIENNTIKVIPMKEYLKTYDPERSYRIYNLPGRIVKKEDAKNETKK